MTKTYRFADVNVRVEAIHSAVLSFCSGYETDGLADLSVSTNQEDIRLSPPAPITPAIPTPIWKPCR